MGIFGDFAPIYWELGYSIVPVNPNSKATNIKYDKYRDKQCSKEELDLWCSRYGNHNIAVVVGKASGLGMIDLDIKNNPDLLNKALNIYPRSPIERFGSKGLGIIIKYNGQSHRKIRFKGKEIGEIITNTIIVIPPSMHPETKKPYTWTGYQSLESELKEDMLDLLPCPTDEELNTYEYQLENSDAKYDKDYLKEIVGRNNTLKSICGSLMEKGLLPEQIAPMVVAEDLLLHSKDPLFSDEKEFKSLSKNPLACAYKFTISIFKTYLMQKSIRKEAIPQFELKTINEVNENIEYFKYKTFFDVHYKLCNKDILDGLLKKKDKWNIWSPVGNELKALKSYVSDVSLSPGKCEGHFKRYEINKKAGFLFKQDKWDGQDHIAEMVSYVGCSNMNNPEVVELFKHWLAGIFNRFNKGHQNHMIVFQGEQGTGKDIFIEKLLGGFAPYFSNFTDTSQEKDMFMQLAKNLILNISEFDKLNRHHPGLIKDLITRKTSQFRPSHLQHFQDFRMIASFIGTTNAKDFLTDYTGNRRFWILSDTEIDWSYPKNRQTQIVAQSIELARQDFKASKKTLDKIFKQVSAMTPPSADEMLIETWNNCINELEKDWRGPDSTWFHYEKIEHIMHKIKGNLGYKTLRPVQSAIIRLGGRTVSDGKRYHKISERSM